MEHNNELLEAWVGQLVTIQATLGPQPPPSVEDAEQLKDDPSQIYASPPNVGLWLARLVAYDALGVVLQDRGEYTPRYFMPWSAVITIRGRDPEYPEQA